MQKNCFCDLQNALNTFVCYVCKKSHHWQCYDYQITDKQPPQMRCLQCILLANNPLMQFEKYIRMNNKFQVTILKKANQPTERTFSIDLTENYEAIRNKIFILSIFCTKIKEQKKLFEWPSKNIYIEFNNQHHIQYHSSDYGYIPSTCIIKGINTIKLKFGDDVEVNSFFGVVLVRTIKLSEIKARVLDIGREKLIESVIGQQKLQYEEKLKSLSTNDEAIQQDNLFTIKLVDGITLQQLEIPVRGKQCAHFDCFELHSYLIMNEKPCEGRWKCPLCNNIVPVDQLQIDYIQADILHGIKKNYPKIYHLLQRVQLNQHLEYKIEEKYIEEQQQVRNTLLYSPTLSQIIFLNPDYFKKQQEKIEVFFRFVNEFQKKDNQTSNLLTLASARKLLKKLKDKQAFLNFSNSFWSPYVKFFAELFDIKQYYRENIFSDNIALDYFAYLQDFELICKTISNETWSGLFIEFLKQFNVTQKIESAMALICAEILDKTIEVKKHKMLELILAHCYRKKEKLSPGKNFQTTSILCKMKVEEYINNIVFLSQKLRTVFFNTDVSALFIIRNCINISHLVDLSIFYDKTSQEGVISTSLLLKKIYNELALIENPNSKELLKLILSLLSKNNEKFENIADCFAEYQLGDIKARYKNLEYYGEYYYL